ncbi:MAG TPA: transcriptional regulator [Oligoflexia bacterium]|nr:transcriptional regulator [Oligoflexia bacterium]
MKSFDPPAILADRSRLLIMAALAMAAKPVDFMTLAGSLPLTKGNLSVHLRKLEQAGLISVTKEFIERKPRTSFVCTAQGRKCIRNYLHDVETLLSKV